jgi:outer membrane lipoprotein-sorting protein
MKKVFVLLIALSVLCGTLVFSETLDQILKKNYESRGGLKKLKQVKSFLFEGKIVIPMQGLEFPVKVWQKKPNLMRMEANVMEKMVIQAYNGKIAWWIMPFMGVNDPAEMPENEGKEVIQQAESLDPLVDYKEKGHKLELVGKEDMEGTEVFKLKLTEKDGRIVLFFLETDSCIEIKTATYIKRGEEENLVESFLGDYKEVEGIMFPFSVESKMNGNTVTKMAIESVKLNEKMDNSLFEMPAKKTVE